jgi:2'-5' RNA ligase
VWLLRLDVAEVRARLDAVAEAVAPWIARVREPHVTVFVAGFPCGTARWDDDVTEAALAAQGEALASTRVRLRIGPANAFASCVVLEVEDADGSLADVRARLGRGVREVRFAPYQPHVTVGLFRDSVPTGPIASALVPHRSMEPFELEVDAVELVEIDAREAGAALQTRWRIQK